jgi:hypothetical protein
VEFVLTLRLHAQRQTLFGAIFVSVGQNVLDNQLARRLSGIPGITSSLIANTGATSILNIVPVESYSTAIKAYNNSLRVVFQVALCMACLAILGAVCMEFRTVKKKAVLPKDGDVEKFKVGNGGKGQKETLPETSTRELDGEKELTI